MHEVHVGERCGRGTFLVFSLALYPMTLPTRAARGLTTRYPIRRSILSSMYSPCEWAYSTVQYLMVTAMQQ